MALGKFMKNSIQSYEECRKGQLQRTDQKQNGNLFPNEIFEAADRLLKRGERLLDIGCGNGSLVGIATVKFDEVYGCDISKTALQEANRKETQTVCSDLNEVFLPYKSESFDAITCIEVIEHVLDPIHLLGEINRVLQPRGQLILSTPNIRYFRNLNNLLFKGVFPHTTKDTFVWGGGHLHYFTIRDLSFMLQKTGFKKGHIPCKSRTISTFLEKAVYRSACREIGISRMVLRWYPCGGP